MSVLYKNFNLRTAMHVLSEHSCLDYLQNWWFYTINRRQECGEIHGQTIYKK